MARDNRVRRISGAKCMTCYSELDAKLRDSKVLEISRGFRRLSVVAGFVGFFLLGLLVLSQGPPPTFGRFILALAVFVAVPAIFVLLLGWAIAGFHNPN